MQRSRLVLIALILPSLIALVPLAHSSPSDPTWLPGLWDDADQDDVVILATSASGITGCSVSWPGYVRVGVGTVGDIAPGVFRTCSHRADLPRAPPAPLRFVAYQPSPRRQSAAVPESGPSENRHEGAIHRQCLRDPVLDQERPLCPGNHGIVLSREPPPVHDGGGMMTMRAALAAALTLGLFTAPLVAEAQEPKAAIQVTRTVPILMATTGDPMASGLVSSSRLRAATSRARPIFSSSERERGADYPRSRRLQVKELERVAGFLPVNGWSPMSGPPMVIE